MENLTLESVTIPVKVNKKIYMVNVAFEVEPWKYIKDPNPKKLAEIAIHERLEQIFTKERKKDEQFVFYMDEINYTCTIISTKTATKDDEKVLAEYATQELEKEELNKKNKEKDIKTPIIIP